MFCTPVGCHHRHYIVKRPANTMLKRVGAKTQPCFTPFMTGSESEVSPLSRNVAFMPSCNWRTSQSEARADTFKPMTSFLADAYNIDDACFQH